MPGAAGAATTDVTVEDLRRLRDEAEIRRVMNRYARGVDRRDYDAIRGAYHPDAFDDHGGYKGGVDGLIDWIARRHAVIEQSMHYLAQTVIDFLSADVAVVETYNITLQRYSSEARETIQAWVGDVDLRPDQRVRALMYARYADRFERRDGQWKVAHRTVVIEQVDAAVIDARAGAPISVEPVRGPEDVIFSLLRG